MAYPEWDEDKARSLILPWVSEPGGLMPALHALQDHFGCVCEEARHMLADLFNFSRAEVLGVQRYYDDFRDEAPKGRVIKVCVAEACQAVGANGLHTFAKTLPGVEIEEVYCLGNCAVGPSVLEGCAVYGRMTNERLAALVDDGEGC